MASSTSRRSPGPAGVCGGGSETSLRDAIAMFEGFSGCTLDVVSAPVATGDARRTAADTSAESADLDWAQWQSRTGSVPSSRGSWCATAPLLGPMRAECTPRVSRPDHRRPSEGPSETGPRSEWILRNRLTRTSARLASGRPWLYARRSTRPGTDERNAWASTSDRN